MEKEYQLKEKEYTRDVERLQQELALREQENQKLQVDKDKELRAIRERGVMSKKYMDNIQREQRIMSGVLHRMGLELFN